MAAADDNRELMAALSALAAERLPVVLSQAQADAEARVRAALADALTARMLELAAAPAAAQPPSEPDPVPESEPEPVLEPDAGGLYLLGITMAGAELPGSPGFLGQPLRTVEHGGLAAILADVALSEFGEQQLRQNLEDLDWLSRTARAHEEALEQLCEQLTVVPARLCTVYRAETSVVEMLEREHWALAETLERLEGRREWGVKVFQLAAPPAGEPDPPDTAEASGADYLRARQREQDQRRNRLDSATAAAEQIHRELAAGAVETVLNPLQRHELSGHDGLMLLNGSDLVEREHEGAFLELVGELAARQLDAGLELAPTGPWPPYNFVSDPIGAGR